MHVIRFTDVDVEKPDEKSVMTYVAQFLKAYPEAGEDPAVSRLINNYTCHPNCIRYLCIETWFADNNVLLTVL